MNKINQMTDSGHISRSTDRYNSDKVGNLNYFGYDKMRMTNIYHILTGGVVGNLSYLQHLIY